MKTLPLLAALLCAVLLCLPTRTARAQYDLSPDTVKPAVQDTTAPAADSVRTDSAKTDTTSTETARPRTLNEDEIPAEEDTVPKVTAAPTTGVVSQANTWLRRLLLRGKLDATEIGAYAQYQLTPWDEKVGSYGPVEARLTVYYLGTSEWMGRDAEWLQAVYQTVEGDPTTVEYDLIVPTSSAIKQIHRALYRVDGEEMKSVNLTPTGDQLDYDAADQPIEEGPEQLKLYSGTFNVEKLRGAGSDGANVVIYRSKSVLPLNVVRLGYGDEGLTLIGTGSDAAPRMDVPPPPSVSHGN